MKTIYLIVAGLIILAGAWFFLNQRSGSPVNTTGVPGATGSSDMVVSPNAVATITYSDSGFSPKSVTVAKGDTVAITNRSSRSIQFDSNPHPLHTDNSELNVGTIPPGETMKVTLTKSGTWGYHDHLDASQGGTIVVR